MMIEMTGPVEEMTLQEVNRHRAQLGILIEEEDHDLATLTALMEMLVFVTERSRLLDQENDPR